MTSQYYRIFVIYETIIFYDDFVDCLTPEFFLVSHTLLGRSIVSSKSVFPLSDLLSGWKGLIRSGTVCRMLADLRFSLSIGMFPTATGLRWSCRSFWINNFLPLYHGYAVHPGNKYAFPSVHCFFYFQWDSVLKNCVILTC